MSCDNMTYFVIGISDGDTSVEDMSEAELLKMLNPDEFGEAELDPSKALMSLDGVITDYWGDGFLIIKGEVVVPQVKQVATQVVM